MALVIPIPSDHCALKTANAPRVRKASQLVFVSLTSTLTKMKIEVDKQAYLLFDGDCGICSWSAQEIQKMDRRGMFVIQPYQNIPEAELLKFGITREQCNKKIQVIARGQRVYRRVYQGAFGINYFLWQYWPWKLLMILIYAVPIVLGAELLVYAWVARNRDRLSQWLGLNACALKPQGQSGNV
jgi:predicted DCC family thiol-disulfide oxidoreductase YuxK